MKMLEGIAGHSKGLLKILIKKCIAKLEEMVGPVYASWKYVPFSALRRRIVSQEV